MLASKFQSNMHSFDLKRELVTSSIPMSQQKDPNDSEVSDTRVIWGARRRPRKGSDQ